MQLTSQDKKAAREGFAYVVVRGGKRVCYASTLAEAKRECGSKGKVVSISGMRYTAQNPHGSLNVRNPAKRYEHQYKARIHRDKAQICYAAGDYDAALSHILAASKEAAKSHDDMLKYKVDVLKDTIEARKPLPRRGDLGRWAFERNPSLNVRNPSLNVRNPMMPLGFDSFEEYPLSKSETKAQDREMKLRRSTAVAVGNWYGKPAYLYVRDSSSVVIGHMEGGHLTAITVLGDYATLKEAKAALKGFAVKLLRGDGSPLTRNPSLNVRNPAAMTKSDKAVIIAFTDHRPASGKKLSTDGNTLNGHWMGGDNIAHWRGDKIHFTDLGSVAAQRVQRAVAKEAPRNWLARNPSHRLLPSLAARNPARGGTKYYLYTGLGPIYYQPLEGRFNSKKQAVAYAKMAYGVDMSLPMFHKAKILSSRELAAKQTRVRNPSLNVR